MSVVFSRVLRVSMLFMCVAGSFPALVVVYLLLLGRDVLYYITVRRLT